jgi:hypothetical protein
MKLFARSGKIWLMLTCFCLLENEKLFLCFYNWLTLFVFFPPDNRLILCSTSILDCVVVVRRNQTVIDKRKKKKTWNYPLSVDKE